MPHPYTFPEHHYITRIGWLRAAVLGANDGIVSTASIITGVASAGVAHSDVLLAGIAGLVAGAMSMAAGEYVSVSSQSDTERADLEREIHELTHNHEYERAELADIYVGRGLTPELAEEVAKQLMEHDALGAHARDELGITDDGQARPLQAAWSSGVSFTTGAALPLGAAALTPLAHVSFVTTIASLIALAILGAVSARTGGAPVWRAIFRVTAWGAAAMAATALVGYIFGTQVA